MSRIEINYPIMVYLNPIGFINSFIKKISADGIIVDTGHFFFAQGRRRRVSRSGIVEFRK